MIQPFSTTGIGSLPNHDPEEACTLILRTFDIPFWPQLPQLSFLERMIPQYSEGLPFALTDSNREEVFCERDESDQLDRFYESCREDCRIAISEDYARGLHSFLRMIRSRRFQTLKGHVTGPLTFTLGLKDRSGRLVYYDEELRQVSLMLLQAKTRWQIELLKQHAEEVLIFIDEPILSALGGSTYLGVSREETLRLLTEIVKTVSAAGATPGIHCCANADWSLVIESGVRIISFDAWNYFEHLSIYYTDIRKFLDQGGYLAWGIVPTTDAIQAATPESVPEQFEAKLGILSGRIPRSLILSQALLTPSCGTGSLSVEEAIKVFQLLIRLKESYG